MNAIWEWFVENWALIRAILSAVIGLLLFVFVRHQGKLKEVALLVWAAVWELAKEGQVSVTREMVDTVAGTVWAWLKDSSWGTWLDRLGITEKMVADAAWKVWLLFEDAIFEEGDRNEYSEYLNGVQAARAKLVTRGLVGKSARPFNPKHLS
jgi:hypothetical protein